MHFGIPEYATPTGQHKFEWTTMTTSAKTTTISNNNNQLHCGRQQHQQEQ